MALAGASVGALGAARVQYHLRQSFIYPDYVPFEPPGGNDSKCRVKFDEPGNFRDEKAKELIRELLTRLVEWTRLLRAF